MNSQPLTLAEAAASIGAPVITVKQWAQRGKIAGAAKFGRAWAIPRGFRPPESWSKKGRKPSRRPKTT